jgi:bacterioferritin
MNTDDRSIIESLNRMLAQEHACAIRYATHAATVSGPSAEAIAARLLEISTDEIAHAQKLRKRILSLGGVPTMDVARDELKASPTLKGILDINVLEERGAIEQYRKILETIPRLNVLLYATVEEILRDEQEHLEELQNLFVQS